MIRTGVGHRNERKGHHAPRRAAIRRFTAGVGALIVAIAVGAALAQYQINRQLNSELYGNGVGSMRNANLPFYQASLLSDFRNDAFLSGSLRSDLRGNYLATGPLV